MKQLTKDLLDRYVKDRIPVGGFLMKVLENNLMESFNMADETNRADLHEICKYVYNDLPALSWGSPEKVDAWLANGGRNEKS